MEKLLKEILGEIKDMKNDISHIKSDVSTLKDDVSQLKEDVVVLKKDVLVLKEDVLVLKEEVSIIKENQKIMDKKIDSIHDQVVLNAENIGKNSIEIRNIKEDIEYIKYKELQTEQDLFTLKNRLKIIK